jgi:hypothetical protein
MKWNLNKVHQNMQEEKGSPSMESQGKPSKEGFDVNVTNFMYFYFNILIKVITY